MNSMHLKLAVRAALAGSAFAAAAVHAQAPVSKIAAAVELQEVIVTGSRVATKDAVSVSPVVSVNAEDIEQRGIVRVEDILSAMPQVYAAQNSAVSNGATGTATISLRGLGSNRTLVLVNGHRLAPGDYSSNAADLNQIPSALVDRIDVLTGGASSVYGADAVAGVVNFVLNDHFEGFKVSVNGGVNMHTQSNPQGVQDSLDLFNQTNNQNFASAPHSVTTGATKDASAVFGFNLPDGRGNVTAYLTYRNIAAVLQAKYDYSAATVSSGYLGSSYCPGPSCGKFGVSGSSTSFPGRVRLVNFRGQNLPSSVGGGSKVLIPNADGSGLQKFGNANRYNYGPLNYYQRPDEQWTGGAMAHYEFNDHVEAYTEISYAYDHTLAQIAPSGSFYGSGPYKVNCSNPLFSQAILNQYCGGSAAPQDFYLLIGRRNIEGGPRIDDLTHSTLHFVGGAKGRINDVWDYDVYAQNDITQVSETFFNDLSTRNVRNALDVVTDPTTGKPVCSSVVSGLDANCVPWNIWQPGGVTSAAVKYLSVPLVSNAKITQQLLSANVTGDLGKYGLQLPTAKTGLRVNIGAEWREVTSDFSPDYEFITGDAAGAGSPTLPTAGSIISREAFGEARLPLADNKFLVHSAALEAGYRYSSYSLGFNTNTYKIGLQWSPVEEVNVRGSFARAVRAPNIAELYTPVHVGLDGSSDTCSGGSPGYSQAVCARGNPGVTAGNYGSVDPNPASQYNGQIGGNPNLTPETALTTTFGVGYSPQFVPGLHLQADYYDIKISNTIATVGAGTIQQLCYTQSVFCDRIHRDINSSLWVSTDGFIKDPLANQGALEEKGVDLALQYRLNLGSFGKLNTSFSGTYIKSYYVTPLQSRPETGYDCVGYYGNNCGSPTFRWRHNLTETWVTPWHGLDVTLGWRYFDSVKLDQLSSNPNLAAPSTATVANGGISSTDAKLSSRTYIDLSASMDVVDNINVRIGVNNLFDKNPPVVGTSNLSGGNGNTFPSFYDALGRYVFATVTAKF
jgi:iron complex outermembrane recepter protein